MNRKTLKETDRFKLKTADGREFIAIETTEFINAESLTSSGFIPGLKTLETSEGYHITSGGGGRYRILEIGQDATRE